MTRFHFRLQSVMEWREKQLELEESRFKQLAGEIAQLDRMQVDLEAAGAGAEIEVRRTARILGQDLVALAGYRRWLQDRMRQVARERAGAQRRLASQEQAMLEARRRCRLLERLKERRLADWQGALNKELDEVAAESYLARWVREA